MNSQTGIAASTDSLAGFEDEVRAILQDGKVPGAAVIMLKGDEVLLAQGFGKRNVAEDLDVTPQTLFPIGSSGKAFTAAAIAMLVEEGKLGWDTPVRHYLPTFKLQDPFASERLKVRDLLCHRCGLPRHEFLWYGSDMARKELVERLAYLEPNADFRARYQYNNLMYATAGYVIECVTGQTWEAFVAERIFKPLGMTASNTAIEASLSTGDYALPYEERKDEIKEVPFYSKFQAMGPAGGISTNLEDIEHWLRFQLNEGKHGETQLLAAEHLVQNHTPHTVIPAGESIPTGKYPEIANWCYGQGWFVGSYRGHRMVHHGGSIDGFMAEVALLPDEQIAIAVFTNRGGTPVPFIIAFTACDRLLGAEKVDWNGRLQKEFADLKAQGEKQIAELQKAEPAVPDTQPSHELDAYCGRYEHPGYGVVTISQENNQLRFIYNDIPSSLTHVHYDIFELTLERFEFKAKVSFATAEKGDIESLAVKLEPAVNAQVFTRVPEKKG
ncbi:MAG: serine hydrolase [Ktedonobacteraceae bacterium]|nr:serine hydrolase [Ktedonobacteraceae bacterium]MBO0789988.1 serine hydrolase [Ktedonobacteraceae bacterium]